MLVCFLRSSSIGTHSMCEQKYFLSYVLGMRDKENIKAVTGSVMHKALEVLGQKRIAQKNRKRKVKTDGLRDLTLKEADDIELITTLALEYYEQNSDVGLNKKEHLQTCIDWVNKAITYDNCKYDPRNQNIIAVEEFFEFEIKKDWAKYSYLDGEIEGYLGLKGTVDVIIDEGNDFWAIQDYKSGRRLNWATGEVKTHKCFQKDPQLLLYYYALKTKYPDKHFLVRIYYVNPFTQDGETYKEGVFEMAFDDDDYEYAENMIRQKFEYIKSVELPKQLYTDAQRDAAPKFAKHGPFKDVFKCRYLCAFSQEWEDSGRSTCQFIHDEIKSKGIDAVTKEYGNLEKINSYTEGGGKIHK